MKLYPAQSECPYCHTVYRYSDLRKLKNAKTKECYHCKKQFAAKKIYKAIPIAIACIVMIIVNLILFHTTADISKGTFAMIVMTDAAVILTAFVISPLFVRLKKLPGQVNENKRKRRKDR